MSQFWCADALLLSVTNGTVRLHARSHARGLKPSTCYEIGQCTAYGGYPGKHHVYTLHMLCWLAASMTLVTFPTPILKYAPRSGLAQAQPADIYSLFLSTNLSGRSIFSYNHRKCLVLDRLSFPVQPTTHHVKSSPLAAVP